MPFRDIGRLEQRIAMLLDYDTGAHSVVSLCELYGVSRETFYGLRRRRDAGEADWFLDRSHAPLSCPHRMSGEMAAAVADVRRRFPHFGPKKIQAWLKREQPRLTWPAASTIGDELKRAGLVEARRRRRRPVELGLAPAVARSPNAEWSCDFKGWFRTRDGQRCDPLTISDTHSRYLLDVRIAEPSLAGVKPLFQRVFEAYGLPDAIRCDNGSPFGSTGAGGLTRLSVWWLKLGVEPRFTRPGSPQDNGRHERMHRTLREQTADTPAADPPEQQSRFDGFVHHLNHERPHEALDQKTPAQLWRPSTRRMPERIEEPWYDADHQVRRVRSAGEIKWKGELVFVGEALRGEPVGIAQRGDGSHIVRFCKRDLGVIDPCGCFRRFAPLRHRLREAPENQRPRKLSGINPV
jgi:transposase InsO family protein